METIRTLTKATLFIVAALCFCQSLVAQSGLIKNADKKYAAFSYKEAARLYELAVGKGAPDIAVASRAADSYWHLRDLRNAERWYAKAVALPSATAEDVYRYSESLRSNGKVDEADKILQRFKVMASTDSRADIQNNATDYVKTIASNNLLGATIKNLDINTEYSDMGAGILGQNVTFASSRLDRASEERYHTWNQAPFLDLYIAKAGPQGELFEVERMDGPFNTKYHESNVSASTSGQDVLFTRNNYDGFKRRRDEAGVTGLKIYTNSRTGDGIWGKENGFIHNSDSYSVGHPALTADGKRLYFTSNRPGGKGGTDIWFCDKNGSGAWGQAFNAVGINTEGNEMFPFVSKDGILFFASDGHKGLGGLDLLMASISGNTFSKVRNLGAPINSSSDDFGMVLRNDSIGYFTSDRIGGKGDDDIYSVKISKKLKNDIKIDGVVRDGETNAPIAGVLVKKIGANGEVLDSTITDATGKYSFPLDPGQKYAITADKEEFTKWELDLDALPESDTLVTRDLVMTDDRSITFVMHVTDLKTGKPLKDVAVNIVEERSAEPMVVGLTNSAGDIRTVLEKREVGDKLNMNVRLSRQGYLNKKISYSELIKAYGELKKSESMEIGMQAAGTGDDLGSLIDLDPIYFDVNSSDIRPDAAEELDKIVETMKENAALVIELGSHTDCRSSAGYNMALSDRRAKSSANYIVSKGISRKRISGKGYGESKLVNDCGCEGTDESPCSDDQHQLNRRTEFIIKKM